MRKASLPLAGGALALALAVSMLASACGDDDSTNATDDDDPVAIDIVSGDGQFGQLNTQLALPLVVHLTDADDDDVEGATVTWTVGPNNGSLSANSTTTNADGETSVLWTLGSTVKMDSARAKIANGDSVIFIATILVATGTQLSIVTGNNQTLTAGQTTQPFVVKVTGANGSPMPNMPVTWTTNAGTLSATTTGTDGAGEAQVTLTTTSSPRTYTVTASLGSSLTQTFTVTTN